MRLLRFLLGSLLALCCLPAFAQSVEINSVSFTGAPVYDPAALLKTTGLKTGSSGSDQIQAGAQKLSDTGLFTSVGFKYDGEMVTYGLTPNPQLLRATFDNFVWLTPEEIDRGLRARIPLYAGAVPAQGSFAASVADALMRMLKEKSVTASVTFLQASSSVNAPSSSVNFRASSPAVTVTFLPKSAVNTPSDSMTFHVSVPAVKLNSVTLRGATPEMEEKLVLLFLPAAKQDYSEIASRKFVAGTIDNLAFENGYMEEHLTNFEHSAPVAMGDHVNVDVVAAIELGQQYHVSEVVWVGSPVLSKVAFDSLNPVKSGSLASRQKLLNLAQAVGGYYYRNGYMNAKLHVMPAFDRANGTVAYTITAEPDEQFHVATVKFLKLTPAQEEAVRKVWTMNPGDLYDRTYVTSFLHNNRDALAHVLPNYVSSYIETANPDQQTVDLVVSFVSLNFKH